MSDTNVHRVVGNLLVGTSHFFVDTTTNQVGINTSSPSAALDVATGDVKVGSGITLASSTGTITATGGFSGDGSGLSGVNSDSGSWVNGTNSNVHLATSTDKVGIGTHSPGAELHVAGTGAIVVPSGTTEQRPGTEVNGMIRYNSTTGYMEVYAAAGWAPIAQPPTVTGISPLTTLPSGGYAVGWNMDTKIQASDPEANDFFGYSVSTSSDGTKVIVGAPYEDTGGTNAGSAYIFAYDGSSWSQEAKIQSSDIAAGHGANDNFGWSVSMNSDGTKVIVAAPYEDTGAASAGSAYIFAYDGSSWSQEAKIQSSDIAAGHGANDNFGHSVSMSGDGTKVIVGAKYEDTGGSNVGSAYIFAYDGSSWTQEANLQSSDIAAGHGANDNFGYSVSMNSDGTKVIVAAPYEDTGGSNAGSAYIFAYDGSSWSQEAKIQASDPEANDNFGHSVSMNSDGTRVIVGALYEDTGAANAGTAYIFAYDGSSWAQEANLQSAISDPEVNDYFGYSVSMNSDGTKVIVGAYSEDTGGSNAGSAYIFALSGGSWSQEAKIQASDPEAFDEFGISVSVSGDGTRVIVGARYEDTGGSATGSAYTFDYRTTALFDTSTQVFTATGTGIVSGSTVQLEGADGSLYSVVDATAPNAAGTQVTFKMGSEAGGGVEFPPSAMSTNTSITGYVASASYGSSQNTAWKAFDDVVTTGSYWNASDATYSTNTPYLPQPNFGVTTHDINGTLHIGHWIQLEIPSPVVLSRAVIGSTHSSYQHGQFVILGHNGPLKELTHHGEGWTLLHAGNSYQASGSSLSTNVTTLSAGSTEAFKYFRVVIKSKTNTSTNGDIELNNVQFFGGSGSWDLAQQPYKVRINSTSGLSGASTAAIGFPTVWTTAANANLDFETGVSMTQTLVGTDGGGGTNRTFSVAPGSNALPSGLTLTGSTGAITGTIAANQDGVTTSVTFRLTDNTTGLFTDRAINIVGISALYAFTSHTFTNAGQQGRFGPTLSDLRNNYTPTWTDYSSNLNVTIQGTQEWTVPSTGSYTIKAAGGAGGGSSGIHGDSYLPLASFRGIEMQRTVTLTRGVTVRIVAGQMGSAYMSGGGGGGSFVYYNATDTYPILAAGGGGAINGWSAWPSATRSNVNYVYGAATDGQSGTSGANSSTGELGGTNGGGGARGGSYAGGGAGWLSDGANSNTSGSGGHAPRNDATGGLAGASYTPSAHGGFGGGGATHGNYGGAGGGGGYSGGAGSTDSGNQFSGGGGSYGGTATGVYNAAGPTYGDGHGYVIITKN